MPLFTLYTLNITWTIYKIRFLITIHLKYLSYIFLKTERGWNNFQVIFSFTKLSYYKINYLNIVSFALYWQERDKDKMSLDWCVILNYSTVFNAIFMRFLIKQLPPNSDFPYIDDLLSLNNPTFSEHLDQIYPSKLEIRN